MNKKVYINKFYYHYQQYLKCKEQKGDLLSLKKKIAKKKL